MVPAQKCVKSGSRAAGPAAACWCPSRPFISAVTEPCRCLGRLCVVDSRMCLVSWTEATSTVLQIVVYWAHVPRGYGIV
uniref:Uncharacterized protein n=1 Tax=Setaria italica TaxID=4555 RepID=K3Y2X8_SETIT